MIQEETKTNFNTLVLAAKNDDLSLVSCKDSKGRAIEVLAICTPTTDGTEYAYLPFAVLISPSIYPLLNKISPPDNLKGVWFWNE